MLACHPLTGIGEIQPGADLPAALATALRAFTPAPDDILVVTQKIISKAENRFVDLATVIPGVEAQRLAAITKKDARLVELVLTESTAILRAVPHVLITRHRSGHVMANAGIDRSNTGAYYADHVLLLPADSDASASCLLTTLRALGISLRGLVISDSFGRPWRLGVVNVALGSAGLPALADRRGEPDRDSRPLEVTQIALADMLATTAGLVMGEGAESVPAVLIQGLALPPGNSPAAALIRPLAEDLFQ